MKAPLPVESARLKAEFPELTEDDLQAYATVTGQVLGDPATRGKKMREVMGRAREAQQKAAAGGQLTADESLLVRYLAALAKMQRSTARRQP